MEEATHDRQERAARNQSMWREINELVVTNKRDKANFTSFVCECVAETCTDEVLLTKEEYEAVRSEPNRFFVKPGHVVPDVELVTDSGGAGGARYQVVEKVGEAGQVAAERDPRAGSG